MIAKNTIFWNKKIFGHILFWIMMLIYYISSSWPFESNKLFLFERMFSKILVQIVLSYLIVYVLIPTFLNRKHRIFFAISSLSLIYIIYVSHTAIRCYYLVPKYPEIYEVRPPLIFMDRISNAYAFLGNLTGLVFPSILLVMYDYFEQQKEVSLLREQKKTTELNLLKNQLNPHFLFNTLNNLYALALKKSDSTPEAIAKLSDILDYMLYRCKENFVPLINEVNLIDNYIALEKIRYGKRLHLSFDHHIEEDIKIAPLILLTFVENAFKHGISQELNVGTIDIVMRANRKEIYFKIDNSKPKLKNNKLNKKRDSIGIENIRKQLEILYDTPNYLLSINEDSKMYSVTLKLAPNDL